MNCALYVRVSTGSQDTDDQVLQLQTFAASQNWTVTNIFSDEISGGKAEHDRPGFKAMMDAASRREFDVLLFWSLDRLSREGALQTLMYLQRLDSYRVGWRSFTEAYLDSTGLFRDAVISILATIARQERIRLSERVRAGLEKARNRGSVLGRPKVNVKPEEIRALRASGMSWKGIAKKFGIARSTAQSHALQDASEA